MGSARQERRYFNVGMAKKFMQTCWVADAWPSSRGRTSRHRCGRFTTHQTHDEGLAREHLDGQNESDPLIEDLEVTADGVARGAPRARGKERPAASWDRSCHRRRDRVDCAAWARRLLGAPPSWSPSSSRFGDARRNFVLLVEKGTQWNGYRRISSGADTTASSDGQRPAAARRAAPGGRLHEEYGLPVYVLLSTTTRGATTSTGRQAGLDQPRVRERADAFPRPSFSGSRARMPIPTGCHGNVGIQA